MPRHFKAGIFCRKLINSLKQRFDFGNGYFDNDYGQTLFLDGILMDIMKDNGQIWCKLSALVMVYLHGRTPTFHLEWVFNPPYGRIPFEHHLC